MLVALPAFILLAAFLSAALPGNLETVDAGSGGPPGSVVAEPPPQAAARFSQDVGECFKFLSVFVPAQGGRYAVGVSFAFRDLDQNGLYTPGTDKLEVCVNCDDACDWGP
jgi:hypothetical protein